MARRFDPLSSAGSYRVLYVAAWLGYLLALVALVVAPHGAIWRTFALGAAALALSGLLAVVIRAFFAEPDEFQRRVRGEAMMWASGCLLVALTLLGVLKLCLPSQAGVAADRMFLVTVLANVIPAWVAAYDVAFQLVGDRYA
ncbi:MAG TPA: hypothetical protein VHX64_11575 [Caulobacteraceae bacterium]|jgi:membrane protease YdiL (CAAX protease family)|nr:hypothetical protein [Caulobacteraceae bacterium]